MKNITKIKPYLLITGIGLLMLIGTLIYSKGGFLKGDLNSINNDLTSNTIGIDGYDINHGETGATYNVNFYINNTYSNSVDVIEFDVRSDNPNIILSSPTFSPNIPASVNNPANEIGAISEGSSYYVMISGNGSGNYLPTGVSELINISFTVEDTFTSDSNNTANLIIENEYINESFAINSNSGKITVLPASNYNIETSNEPSGLNNQTPLNIDVNAVSGGDATHYKYDIIDANNDCNGASYSALISVNTNITDAITSDGHKTLCVKGFNFDGSEEGALVQKTWESDITLPVFDTFPTNITQDTLNDSENITFNVLATDTNLDSDSCTKNSGDPFPAAIGGTTTTVTCTATDTVGHSTEQSFDVTLTKIVKGDFASPGDFDASNQPIDYTPTKDETVNEFDAYWLWLNSQNSSYVLEE